MEGDFERKGFRVIIIYLMLIPFGEVLSAQKGDLLVKVSYQSVVYPFFKSDYKNDGSYKAGGVFSFSPNNKVSVGIGFNYEEKKYYHHYIQNSPGREILSDSINFSYLGVPIEIEILMFNRHPHHLSIYTSGEFLSMKSKEMIRSYSDGTSRDVLHLYDIPENSFSLCLGVSYRYFLFDNVFLGVMPKVRTNLSSITSNFDEHTILSFIFEFSIGYRFVFGNK